MDYSTHRKYRKRPIIMAVLMIIVGLLTIDFRYDSETLLTSRTILRLVSGVVLIVFGFLILHPRFREIMPAVGMMCLGIGISRFFVAISNMTKVQVTFVLTEAFDTVVYILSYVILVFSIYQIYRGYNFLNGDAMNAFVMRFSSMGIIIVYVLVLIYARELIYVDLDLVWDIRRDFITTPILYLMYFILLCSKEVYDMMYYVQIRRGIMSVAGRLNPGTVTATSPAMRTFRRSYADETRWKADGRADSPVERTLSLDLIGEGADVTLTLEKWKDEDFVRYSLLPAGDAPYVSAQRGRVHHAEFEDGGFRLFNDDHMAIQIGVYDKPVKVRRTLAQLLRLDNDDDEDTEEESNVDPGVLES